MYDKMNIINSPNWNLEALGLLSLCYSDNIENVIKKFDKSAKSKTKLYLNKILSYKEASYDDITNIINEKYSNLLPYIKLIGNSIERDNEDESKIKEVQDMAIIESFFSYFNVFKCETMNQIDYVIKEVLNSYKCNTYGKDKEYKFDTLDNILQYFMDAKIQDRVKLMFIEFYLDRYNFVKKINEMQSEIKSICKQNFKIIEKYYIEYCDMVCKSDKFLHDLKEYIPLDININDKVDTYITVGFFNQMSVRCFDKDYLVYIGMCMLDLCIDDYNNKDEAIISDLKIISDNTRFKILRSLQNKEKYLQELADELKLTPATISHHINILLSQSYVGAKINTEINKRVVYYVSKDRINSLIENLTNTFSGK